MPMHTTGEETWLPSRVGPSPTFVPYLHPLGTPPRPYPPRDLSSVTSQPYHSPPANLGYSFTIDDGPHNGPHIRTMLPLPSELSDEPPTEYNHADFDPLPMINGYPSYFDAPRPSDPMLNASSSSKRKRATPVGWSPGAKKAKPSDQNQGDEAILDVILNKPRSDLRYRVNTRINNLVKRVTEVLSKSNISDQLRDLSVEEAQCTLDFLQDLLDISGIPVISKRTLLKTSLRLTRTHDCVPRCLVLRGFRKTGDHAFALGHFGEVWRGEVEGVEVAVKQARIFTSDNNIKKVLRQVRREAIIWRQCDHPNVLPFYGIYRDSAPSTYCLVSPFMVNGSLRQYMNRIHDPDRHNLAVDITRGMNYLHTLSIVHGDLKGDNVLITDDCRAVIADFGISFVMGVTTFATSSSSHKGGTMRWEAPEVLSGSPNSFPADVYSLACVYFEVFDGTIPWNNLKDGAVIKSVCFEKKHLPYPKHLGSTGHAELWWKLMVQCWAHEPSDRLTLHDLMEALHATGDTLFPVRKWDNPVLGRLRDPLVHGKLPIPSGLPPFLDIKGDCITAPMTLLNNGSILECIPDCNFPPPSNSAIPESMGRVPSPHSQAQQPSANDGTQTPSPIDIRGPGDQSILTKPEQSLNSRRYCPHDPASYSRFSFPGPLDLNVLHLSAREHQKFPSPTSPATQSDQRMWWDNFLKTYPLPDVADDLTYLFTDAGYWLSFLNVKFFRDTLLNAQERIRIQPAFVLAALAMSTLMKSSETEYAVQGRTRALYLRSLAQSALEAAWESEWIDAALAEAALILALFETSVHPDYSPTRVENALIFLDNIVRRLSLTSIDTNDPEVSFFPQRGVPVVLVPGLDTFSHSPHERKCSCIPTDASHPPDPFNTWSYPLPWDSSWSTNEIRDEECRRVCWSALGLIANYTLQCAAFDRDPPKLFLSSPSNYALLFPGEAVDRTSPPYRSADSQSQKESVWALYCRSMLLWCFCDQLRREPYVEEDKAEYAHEAWNETQSIQDSLDLHVCNLDTAVMYMCREYIYNSRMAITQALRSLHGLSSGGPVFTRKQADEWIYYQEQIVKRVTMSIQRMAGTQGHQLTRRPFQVTWFSNQLALCLRLWNNDRSLYGALELAKAIMIPLDMVNSIWPCPQHQHQCDDLRKHLIEACTSVGMGLPSLTNRSLPPLMKTH